MLKLGEKQTLEVIRMVDFGAYLGESKNSVDQVLLPVKQIPENTEIGDKIEVFLYRDSDDRLIATVKEPKIMLGDVAILTVKNTNKIGAFMDWGLEKDVLLPFREQTRPVREGEDILCAMYIDKSDRLCVTMNVYEFLRTDSPYQKEDKVRGTVYEISKNFGAFVAIDDIFSGLIPQKELYGDIKIGDDITARVTGVKADGKLDLSLREKSYIQMDTDMDKILKKMEENGGKLDFNDKASPDLIKEKMQMSKNEFKRAVGHLLKEGKITIMPDSIVMK